MNLKLAGRANGSFAVSNREDAMTEPSDDNAALDQTAGNEDDSVESVADLRRLTLEADDGVKLRKAE